MKLASLGIFGMNRRNRGLILEYNTPSALKLANDKIATKLALAREGVPIPETFTSLAHHRRIPHVYRDLIRRGTPFVSKPARGSRGQGVELFRKALETELLPLHGEPWHPREFSFYLCRIIAGEFSSSHASDDCLIEELIHPDSNWILPSLPAPPDLRIIVFQGKPALAMARLPTMASHGKANLHQGGVGLGISLETGRTTHAILKEKPIHYHPDSGEPLTDRVVDGFGDCLEIAARCAKAVPLGYMGVDIIRDRHRGPVVIEVNGRPGLAIQLANRVGLSSALSPIQQEGTSR